MKKVFLIVAALMFLCGMVNAQQQYSFSVNAYETNMPVTIQVQIDGVVQTSDEIEVGAFVGDVVRASQRVRIEDELAWTQVYFDNNDETVSFKLYDHATGAEYSGCSTTLTTLETGWGLPSTPVVLNFVTTGTFTKDIAGYGDTNGNFYLIASPIGEVNPANVNNMLSTESGYDLYSFNPSADPLEWVNYKGEEDGFDLVPGQGYLYANSTTTSLIFNGTPYAATEPVEVPLVYDPEARFSGWNLVGNPFAVTAYVDRDFYVMNPDGDEIIPTQTDTVAAMEGIFVVADGIGDTVTFSTTSPEAKDSMVALNLSNGSNVIDRVIVRFDHGRQLPKFQLHPNSTKLYIPLDNMDYAVVNAESQGEMPINFKAKEDGTYTLTVSTTLNFKYLHLIDSLTGADVDLLVPEPVEGPASYTFTAKTTDYANRFKLVFH
ncbi:MAG: hypothetical protein J6T22_12365 [Bacteroidales bacterium]|nr:hypothetical protein [Bacteroidales bacterium]